MRDKNKDLEGRIEEVTREAHVFTAKLVQEERLKMFKNFKDSEITSWDPEAQEKSLKKLNGEEEMGSKIERVSESGGVERVHKGRNIVKRYSRLPKGLCF